MKFSLLLFALGQIFRAAPLFSRAFRHRIRKSRVRILIKTLDSNRARLFEFNKGKVRSRSGELAGFDAALIFRDSGTGFRVLTSRRMDASFNAAADGDLHIEGAGVYAQWFEDTTRIIF